MGYAYFFFDDYSEGAHPEILEELSRASVKPERTYGTDSFSVRAEVLIQEKIKCPQAKVHFVSSGTHANIVCLASMLKPYESVISSDIGHANDHEAGAIEATGHKMHSIKNKEAKIYPPEIQKIVDAHTDEQMVMPRVVYISQSTERGTIYSKKELEDLATVCKKNKLYLYVDGARLGNALMSSSADFDLADIARLADIFYIGGTKNGGLMGEAIVIPNPQLQVNFRYHLRQRGALLSKSRSVSQQFEVFFRGNLYFENAKHANAMAEQLVEGIKTCGYRFLATPATNVVFPILPDDLIKKLSTKYGFYTYPGSDGTSMIRLVTSWATQKVAVENFVKDLKSFNSIK